MFQRIVAGASRAESARSVGRQAADMANAMGAELHLVSCFDPSENRERPVDAHLQDLLDSLGRAAKGSVVTHVLPEDPIDGILAVAAECDADLIIVGNKGLRGPRRVLGSVPKAVSQRADCAVLILPTT